MSNRRLDGVGDWVLQKNEFETWRKSRDGSVNPTLLCYGGQGVGKTYIRYRGILLRPQTMLTGNEINSLVIDLDIGRIRMAQWFTIERQFTRN